MALSGSFGSNVNTNWRLQADWTATQDVANNTSTITMKLYWMGLNSYGTTYSSATKDGATTINGTTSTFAGAGLGKLTGAEKKLIKTHTVTVAHNADGTKSVPLSAYFDVELDIGVSYVGRVSISGTASLNTIPRASSLTDTTPSWIAGSALSLGISRASSSFTHTAKVYVNGVLIATETGITTSRTVSFTVAENTSIFNQLATGVSKATKVDLHTYSGTTLIGTKSYAGTVTAPARSTTTFSGNFDIGTILSGSINRSNSAFVHTIQLLFGSSVFTLLDKTTLTSWSYETSAIASALYGLTPNDNTLTGKIRITTYYGTEQVGAIAESTINAYVVNSDPTFTDAQISYEDMLTTTKNITGNSQYIIQNQSDLRASINSVAVAKNSATISRYELSLNGVTISTTAIGQQVFGKVNASTDLTLTVKAIDSRGNSTIATKNILVIPYKEPVVNPSAKRLNNFESSTTLTLAGSISPILIGGVNKNILTVTTGLQYRYKESTASTWGGWINFAWTVSGYSYTATNIVLNLDNTKSYNFEFKASDKLSMATVSKTVAVGQPIFFIDAVKKSVGVNKFPSKSNSMEVGGTLEVQGLTSLGSVSASAVSATNVTASGTVSTKDVVASGTLNANSAELNYLNINTTTDIGASTPNIGLRVGSEASNSIRIDGNEILAQTAGVPSNLNIQTEGGKVYLWNNISEYPTMIFEDGYIRNEERINLSLLNGWVNYSSSISTTAGYNFASYWKDKNGVVHLTGMIKSGTTTAGTVIAKLPVGYRPFGVELHLQHSPISSGYNSVRVDVSQTGDITLATVPSASWVSLAGISFKAER